ncbi:MAG: cupredoxin domain-containing protein [Patescibacteria group bacterium]
MQILGVVLILTVVALFLLWIRSKRHEKGVLGKTTGDAQVFDVVVKGVYAPAVLRARLGQKVKINFLRQESSECSRFVSFPDFKIRQELPEGKTVTVELAPTQKGEYTFTCDMSMYQGKLIVE